MRKISFKTTADTSLHIYIECAEKMSIPWEGIYSEFENKINGWRYE